MKKAHRRLFFSRRLNSFRVCQCILVNFYRAIIESILCLSITVWFGQICVDDLRKLNSVVKSAERIIGTSLPSLDSIYNDRMLKHVKCIMEDEFHPANDYFTFLPIDVSGLFVAASVLQRVFYPFAVCAYNLL